jgi:hypothetical protein
MLLSLFANGNSGVLDFKAVEILIVSVLTARGLD